MGCQLKKSIFLIAQSSSQRGLPTEVLSSEFRAKIGYSYFEFSN